MPEKSKSTFQNHPEKLTYIVINYLKVTHILNLEKEKIYKL